MKRPGCYKADIIKKSLTIPWIWFVWPVSCPLWLERLAKREKKNHQSLNRTSIEVWAHLGWCQSSFSGRVQLLQLECYVLLKKTNWRVYPRRELMGWLREGGDTWRAIIDTGEKDPVFFLGVYKENFQFSYNHSHRRIFGSWLGKWKKIKIKKACLLIAEWQIYSESELLLANCTRPKQIFNKLDARVLFNIWTSYNARCVSCWLWDVVLIRRLLIP